MRSSGRGTFRLFLAFLCTGWYDERMKKRVAYYVSRKNPLVWLAALVMLASAALRIANVCGKGADARTVWLLVVLPVTACVFYVLNILCNGKDRFYRSSVPVFLLAIYYGIKVTLVSPYLWLTFVFWIAYLAIAAFYAVTVSGHVKSTIPLLLLLLAAFAVLAAMHEKEFSRGNWDQLRTILPDLLFLLGGILTLLSMKMYLDSAYHPTWATGPTAASSARSTRWRSSPTTLCPRGSARPTSSASRWKSRPWSAISAKSASRALRTSA